MSQHLPQFLQQFRRLSLMLVFAMPALSTYAAGPLTSPNPVIQSIPASTAGSANGLSTEDKKKLLAAPETDAQASTTTGSGVIFQGGNYCDDLQQQIKRTQPATGSLNQTANGNVPQYDERSKLEARYRSECVK